MLEDKIIRGIILFQALILQSLKKVTVRMGNPLSHILYNQAVFTDIRVKLRFQQIRRHTVAGHFRQRFKQQSGVHLHFPWLIRNIRYLVPQNGTAISHSQYIKICCIYIHLILIGMQFLIKLLR